MKKISYFCYLVFIFSIFLIGCEKKNTNEKKVLKLNFDTEPISLDPRIGINVISQSAIRPLFEGLMKIDKSGDLTCGIAKKYTISEDKKTYLFTLRDTNWSNGKKVTARDFEYAWKSAIKEDSLCRLKQLFHPIKNVKKIRDKQLTIDTMGVKALDAKTLQIELEYPIPYFLQLSANPIFSPILEEYDHSNDKYKLISNGPFQLKRYDQNQGMHLIKNPNYYLKDQVKIDEIKISFIKDPQTSMYMFDRKEIDFLGNPICKIPFDEEEKLFKTSKLKIKPIAGLFWLGFNTNQFPYDNVHFRRALAFSLDNKLFSEALNQRKPANTFVPLSLSNLKQRNDWYNLENAKKELNEALVELDCKIEDLPKIRFFYSEQVSGGVKVALLVKKQWESNLNIKVELIEMDYNSFLACLYQHKLEVAGLIWYSYLDDAAYHLDSFKFRNYPSNWTLWENAEYIENLDKANQSSEISERKNYLSKAEEVIKNELPVVPLYYEDYRYLQQTNIHNIVITKLGEIEFRYCSID
jgi:oligopeptide transport system substrate-binding protein